MATVLGTVRRLRIGKRLLAAFGLIVAFIVVIAVVGVSGANSQSSAADELSRNVRLTRDAMQVKFRGADFNGWQTAYAFDVIRGLNNATSDSSPSRKAFLASAAAFRRELGVLSAEQLLPAEQKALNAVDVDLAQRAREGPRPDRQDCPLRRALASNRDVFRAASNAL